MRAPMTGRSAQSSHGAEATLGDSAPGWLRDECTYAALVSPPTAERQPPELTRRIGGHPPGSTPRR